MENMKIKLVAIAKDEAAYISDWVFHHLYFGFDEIEVYVNFTTDPTYEILKRIGQRHPLKYKNAEYLLDSQYNKNDYLLAEKYLKYNPLQSRAYAEAISAAKDSGFTHVMFLDIDEFWTPVCFSKKIKDILQDLSDPKIASFHWKNKVGDNEEFDLPFQKEISYLKKPQIKTLVKLNNEVKVINSHFSISYTLEKEVAEEIQEDNIADEDSVAFILHRFQRSEMEYISMLGRGDPTSAGVFNLKFTRYGYLSEKDSLSISFDPKLIDDYDYKHQEFITDNNLQKLISDGKVFVQEQKERVLEHIKNSIKNYNIVKKVTPGLNLEKDLVNELSLSTGLNDTQINTLRDIALELETQDLEKAYELMKIAYAFKPQGPLIKQKYKQYKLSLGLE